MSFAFITTEETLHYGFQIAAFILPIIVYVIHLERRLIRMETKLNIIVAKGCPLRGKETEDND